MDTNYILGISATISMGILMFWFGQVWYQRKVVKRIEKKIKEIEPDYNRYSNELNELYKEINNHSDDDAWMDDYRDKSSMVVSMGTRIYELKGVLTDL